MAMYLSALPDSHKGQDSKIVKLTPTNGSGHVSINELTAALVAMMENLLMSMSDVLQFISEEQQENAETATLNAAISQNQFQQTSAEVQKEEAAQEAQANEPWWEKALDVILKYVLPLILVAVAFIVFGPAAGIVALAVFILTAIPVHNGQSIVALAAQGVADGIGKACGMSSAGIQTLEGALDIVFSIALAVAGGGIASAGTAVSTVAEATEEVVETATEDVADGAVEDSSAGDETKSSDNDSTEDKTAKFKANAGKFTAFNTLGSSLSGTNAFQNITTGSADLYLLNNPTANANEANEIASWMALALNIITAILSIVGSASSMSGAAESASELNPIAKSLGGSTTTNISRGINVVQTAANVAGAGNDGYQASVSLNLGELEQEATKLLAALHYSGQTSKIINMNSTSLTNYAQQIMKELQACLATPPNPGMASFAEAKALQLANQNG